MSHPNPNRSLYLGMKEGDLAGKPYAQHFNPRLGPLPAHIMQALLVGPVAEELLPRLADVPKLLEPGEQELENAIGLNSDDSLFVAERTEMPGVTPTMIDWWFGWHSLEPQRYKLWHPRAHVHAQWGTPDSAEQLRLKGRPRYVGRTSFVDEYIGAKLNHVAISFLPPSELGFDESALQDSEKVTMICAKIAMADYPVQLGYLVHHVRAVPGGSEMRSRFFLGGPYSFVNAGRVAGEIVSSLARRMMGPSLDNARDLIVHCSQEMSHLATFLPKLYAELSEIP